MSYLCCKKYYVELFNHLRHIQMSTPRKFLDVEKYTTLF